MKKLNILFYSSIITLLVISCKSQDPDIIVQKHFPEFFKEGHRGARGVMPENTIASMKRAIDDGANFIEVDIQISKDDQVLVTHDPYINPLFSTHFNGEEFTSRDYIVHQMNYEDIKKFDVGLKYHSGFPEQEKIPAHIPLLGELIDSIEQYTAEKGIPDVIYNIEIKANPKEDGHFQPEPKKLVGLVMEVVQEKKLDYNRYYIQSFDVRQIQEVHENYPQVVTGFLTGNKDRTLEENLAEIGFTPQIYSPSYALATPELVEEAHQHGMKFVPWTVNNFEDMKRLKSMGVDGIITDFPHLLEEL